MNDLSFQVGKGSVFGILGPNGSGKTTTLGIILGVVNANAGSYSWFGRPNSKEDRKRIGAILEQPLFYPYLSAEKNLAIVARIKGMVHADIGKVLRTVELFDRRDSKFRTYSYGMKQRLAIASALLGDPEVLIFDEPTNGLDPRGIAEIRDLIIRIAAQGITIILASHLLDEVQKTCSDVLVLKNGQHLFSGKVRDVLNVTDTVEVAAADGQALAMALDAFPGAEEVTGDQGMFLVRMKGGGDAAELNRYLITKGIVVSHLAMRRKSLEQQFLEVLTPGEK